MGGAASLQLQLQGFHEVSLSSVDGDLVVDPINSDWITSNIKQEVSNAGSSNKNQSLFQSSATTNALKLDALSKKRRWSRTQSVDYLINYYESTEAAAGNCHWQHDSEIDDTN